MFCVTPVDRRRRSKSVPRCDVSPGVPLTLIASHADPFENWKPPAFGTAYFVPDERSSSSNLRTLSGLVFAFAGEDAGALAPGCGAGAPRPAAPRPPAPARPRPAARAGGFT